MRNLVFFAVIMMAMTGVKAQDCDALMLPYFQNDRNRMEEYKAVAPEKFETECAFLHAIFYESDTVPVGVEVFSINEVKSMSTGENLPQNYVVDLNTLSYYGYSFADFRRRYPNDSYSVCFSTPSSRHPYLVMRSLDEIYQVVNEKMNNKNK